jgi:predicted site-specific integrase-resolvase
VSITTLRRWEAEGRLAAEHTAGGHRRYDLAKLRPELFRAMDKASRKTVAYARVSSHDQKDDLERQKQDTTFEQDLAKDVLEIITVFSARLYGSRSRKNQKLLDGDKQAVAAAETAPTC